MGLCYRKPFPVLLVREIRTKKYIDGSAKAVRFRTFLWSARIFPQKFPKHFQTALILYFLSFGSNNSSACPTSLKMFCCNFDFDGKSSIKQNQGDYGQTDFVDMVCNYDRHIFIGVERLVRQNVINTLKLVLKTEKRRNTQTEFEVRKIRKSF